MAFYICGGTALQGEVSIQGAKNAVLPILAATILVGGEVEVQNCPRLRDVEGSIRILEALGCKARWEGSSLVVDTRTLSSHVISEELMHQMRSSAIFLGAILGRCGEAELSYPGGCELGPRPIDLHLAGLQELGAEVSTQGGVIRCKAPRLLGRHLVLPFPSVGATENLMLAACAAQGDTIIENAAREVEIDALRDFLNECGADISGSGTLYIRGGRPLHGGIAFPILPDRIVTSTYLCACAAAGGAVYLKGAKEQHLSAVTALLRKAGCAITSHPEGIFCRRMGRLKALPMVSTAPYPGFPTDAQAILMAALLKSCGATVFEENLFESRYRHVPELQRMGADIRLMGKTAVVSGVERLSGASVCCTDLRGGAALCVAALSAEGESRITKTHHIARGYEHLPRDFTALGATIREE